MTTDTAAGSDSADATPPPRAFDARLDHAEAALTYLVDSGAPPVTYIPAPGQGEVRRTGSYAPYRVPIRDGRAVARDLSLDRQGFVLTRHDTAVADFHDPEEIARVYYPEMASLVKAATGARRVHVFDHNLRDDGGVERAARDRSTPVRMVHNDYTEKSGPQRVRDLLGDEAEALLQKRFAVINVWRPIAGPVETAPLALADARSIAPDDLVPLDLVYPERTGEIHNALFNPVHRWFTFPAMARHEAVLIKGYDSLDDGRARFTLHTAFDDPASPPDAAPRQSIEVRTLAFFDA
jgi:hypothetical protein